MNQQEIEQYLIDFQKKELPEVIERELKIAETKKIKVIIGPRRAGKTFFLFQLMKHFIKKGFKKEDIIYLNFESTKLFDINFKEIKDIIELHKKLFSESKNPYLFLDEPQNVKNWENAVRELYDEGYNLFITGSSSKLLSKEISTSLRGRSLSYLLLPFSFKEFIKFKKIELRGLLSSVEKTKIRSLLDEYLEFGGFPEIVFEENKDIKIKIAESYFDLTVYKDLVERYKIKDSLLMKWFIKSIASSYSKELSINKIYLTLKSQGRRVSKDELYSYYSMISDSIFAFYHQKFSKSVRKKEPLSKVYLCDNIFVKIIETDKFKGRKMENAVFLDLIRENQLSDKIFFWKNVQQEEVDFVIKENQSISQLIQVCYSLEDIETKQREIRALLNASKELKCKNLLVITENFEGDEPAEWFGLKEKIKFIPLWKWLLRESH